MLNTKNLYILKRRCERLIEQINLNAPDVIINTEILLINQISESLMNEIESYKDYNIITPKTYSFISGDDIYTKTYYEEDKLPYEIYYDSEFLNEK